MDCFLDLSSVEVDSDTGSSKLLLDSSSPFQASTAGAICIELVRQLAGSEFLSRAVVSLTKAQVTSPFPLPALLAQAEAGLGARAKWERNLRFEWFSGPPEMRPAEMYFQMHLLAKQSSAGHNQQDSIELSQSPRTWLLQAIHLNPSCLRYLKVLRKLIES